LLDLGSEEAFYRFVPTTLPTTTTRSGKREMANDSILTSIVPVTGAIYRSGREKPDIKWNFEVKLSTDDIVLSQFKNRLQFFLGVKKRCEELNIDKFTLKLLNMKSAPNSKDVARDRIFAIDTQEQWKDVFSKLIKSDRELVAKCYEVESVSAFDKMTGKATKRKMVSSCDGKINQLQPDEKKAKNGHKAEDSVLFLQLKCHPFGKGVERNE